MTEASSGTPDKTEQLSPAQERSREPLYRIAAAMEEFNRDVAVEIKTPRFQLLRRAGPGGYRYTFFSRQRFTDKDLKLVRNVAHTILDTDKTSSKVTRCNWDMFVSSLTRNKPGDKAIPEAWKWLMGNALAIERETEANSDLLIRFHDRLLQLYPDFPVKGYMPYALYQLRKTLDGPCGTREGYFIRLLNELSQSGFPKVAVRVVEDVKGKGHLRYVGRREQERNLYATEDDPQFDSTDFFMRYLAPIFDASLDESKFDGTSYIDPAVYEGAHRYSLFVPLFEEGRQRFQGHMLGWLWESYPKSQDPTELWNRVVNCCRFSRVLTETITAVEQLEILRQYHGDIPCNEFMKKHFGAHRGGWSKIETVLRDGAPRTVCDWFDDRANMGRIDHKEKDDILWVDLNPQVSIESDLITPRHVGEDEILLKLSFHDDYVRPVDHAELIYQGIADTLYGLYRRLLEVRAQNLAIRAQEQEATARRMLNDVSHSINTDLMAAKSKLANARLCLESEPRNAIALDHVEGAVQHIIDVHDNAETILALEKHRVRTDLLPPWEFKVPDDILSDLTVFQCHRSLLRLTGEKRLEHFFENSCVSRWVECPTPTKVATYKILRVALRDILKNALRHIRPEEDEIPVKIRVSTNDRSVVIGVSNNIPAEPATITSVNSNIWQLGDGHFGIQLYKLILDTLNAQYVMTVRDNWTTVTVTIPMTRDDNAHTEGSYC